VGWWRRLRTTKASTALYVRVQPPASIHLDSAYQYTDICSFVQTKNRIFRAEGAQQNGFENVGLFAAAVVAGNMAGLSATTLNGLTYGYLGSRVLYNLIYINNESTGAANVRSVVFVGGIGMIMTLFVKAGNALASRSLV